MSLLDFIYPKNCLTCKRSGNYLCTSCLAKVKPAKTLCIVCLKPSIDGMTHANCRKKLSMDGIFAAFSYTGVVKRAITTLKYRFATDIAEELVSQTIIKISKSFIPLPKDGILLPVPLSKQRKRWRGFNQAELLGKMVSAKMGWKYDETLLIRSRHTTSQTSLAKEERQINMKNAFVVAKRTAISDTPYIIFDDVWTTGATIREVGKVLKRKGASSVWGMAIAHGT